MTKQKLSKNLLTRTSSNLFSFLNMLPDPDTVATKATLKISDYRDLLSDAHLYSTVQQRFSSVISLSWQLNSTSNQKVDDFITQFLKSWSLDNLYIQILDAVLFGYSVLEIVWDINSKSYLPAEIQAKPQEWFYFDIDNQLKYSGDNIIKDNRNLELPPDKFLLVQHSSTYFNPYGEKLLSKCYWPVHFKRSGMQYWLTFLERYGMPFLVASSPAGASEADKLALMDALEKMLLDTTAIVPTDSTVKFLDAGNNYSSDIYKSYSTFFNSEISKAILSQTLTTEVGTSGSFSASQTHLNVFNNVVFSDKKLIENTLNKLIKLIVDFNFPNVTEYPQFKLFSEKEVREDLAARDKILTEQGLKFTKDYYRNSYNLQPDDFEL